MFINSSAFVSFPAVILVRQVNVIDLDLLVAASFGHSGYLSIESKVGAGNTALGHMEWKELTGSCGL